MKIKTIFLSGIYFFGIIGCTSVPCDSSHSVYPREELLNTWGHGKNPWMLDSEKKQHDQIMAYRKYNALKLNH